MTISLLFCKLLATRLLAACSVALRSSFQRDHLEWSTITRLQNLGPAKLNAIYQPCIIVMIFQEPLTSLFFVIVSSLQKLWRLEFSQSYSWSPDFRDHLPWENSSFEGGFHSIITCWGLFTPQILPSPGSSPEFPGNSQPEFGDPCKNTTHTCWASFNLVCRQLHRPAIFKYTSSYWTVIAFSGWPWLCLCSSLHFPCAYCKQSAYEI